VIKKGDPKVPFFVKWKVKESIYREVIQT